MTLLHGFNKQNVHLCMCDLCMYREYVICILDAYFKGIWYSIVWIEEGEKKVDVCAFFRGKGVFALCLYQ